MLVGAPKTTARTHPAPVNLSAAARSAGPCVHSLTRALSPRIWDRAGRNKRSDVTSVTERLAVMRPVHFRLVAFAAAGVFTLSGIATAQDKSGGLLSNLEVQQLVKHGEPADNTRLGAHFSAVADRYAAEAKKHVSMAQSYSGNPRGNLGTGMSAHCKQLANLNTQSATTARELAAYHQKLATGNPAEPPRDGARL